jgi:hypothetical protein
MNSTLTPFEEAIIACLHYHENHGHGIVKNEIIQEFLIARFKKNRVVLPLRKMIASLRAKGYWQIMGCGKGYYWSENAEDFDFWVKSYESKINSMQGVLSETKKQFNLKNQ